MTNWFVFFFLQIHTIQCRLESNPMEKMQRKNTQADSNVFHLYLPTCTPKCRAEITKTHQIHPNSHFYTPHIQKFLEHFPDFLNSLLSNGYKLSNLSDIDKLNFLQTAKGSCLKIIEVNSCLHQLLLFIQVKLHHKNTTYFSLN